MISNTNIKKIFIYGFKDPCFFTGICRHCLFSIRMMDSEFNKEDFLLLVGKRIDYIREQKGFSYERISQGCNIDASDLSKIAKGRVNIMLSSVMEISKGLEIHPKELFDIDFKLEEKS